MLIFLGQLLSSFLAGYYLAEARRRFKRHDSLAWFSVVKCALCTVGFVLLVTLA